MKIVKILNYSTTKCEIFSGNENEFSVFSYVYESEKVGKINFKLSDFQGQYLNKIKSKCDDDIFTEIIKKSELSESKIINSLYTGNYDLPVYYKLFSTESNKLFLICLSFGERNKGVFTVSIEAFFELKLADI
jgi:hypothetical protein